MLQVKDLSCGYDKKVVLKGVNFTVKPGDMVYLLGANGSGKSTLIKTIVGLLRPYHGSISIDGRAIHGWSWKRRAKLIGYIPQTFNTTFQYRCKDIVLMGRTPYLDFMSSPSKWDREIAEQAMETLNILHLKDRIYSQLSGGERQLVKIAQALAQESKIIVMDEPINNLDFGNRLLILKQLRKCMDLGIAIIMATHFLEHVFLYASKALLIKDGKVREVDRPSLNISKDDLQALYDVGLKMVELDSRGGKLKVCLPIF